ncbi:putative reverse transcriptase domain-containing protein [Tanacetum coccineum]
MADHSQKWHDGSPSQSICSSNNSDGMAAIVTKLDNLGRDMKKLKENVHAIQVGCQLCDGPHLGKECPLNEDAKSATEVPTSPFGQCKADYDDAPINKASSNKANEIHEVTFIDKQEDDNLLFEGLPCQLPPKEINPGSFTLLCTIVSLDFYAMVDLGASINVMPKFMFEHLKLANLKETNMLVETANMTKKVPLGIIEKILVKIDKFLFSLDFVIINMLKTSNETMILGRPFLATIHAEIDVFNKETSLGIRDDRIIFDMNKKTMNSQLL